MPNPMNPIDVIAKALCEGAAEEDQNLDYWHSEARKVWAALGEHGEKAWREDATELLTQADYEANDCAEHKRNGMFTYERVLVLPMPEEPNDA